MKLLDRYIIGKFLGTFFMSITIIVLIVIVFDISEKLEDFITKEAPLKAIVFDYFFNFIPYIVNLFSPLFTFIAVIFFTSKMASQTEIVVILASGTSYRRLLYPFMVAASFIAILSLLLNNFVIPHGTKKRIAFEDQYIRNKFRNTDRNIHLQIAKDNYIYLERYNTDVDVGYRFSIEQFKEGKLSYKLVSSNIKWDSISKQWSINDYYERYIDGINERMVKGRRLDTVLAFTPKDFGRKDNVFETYDYFELNDHIASEKLKGSAGIEQFEVEKHKRNAMPFATFVLTIIGVSIASRKVRGGVGMHLGVGLFLSFSYIMFMRVSTTFATGGLVSPLLSVWIPNFVFMGIAAVLYKYAQK